MLLLALLLVGCKKDPKVVTEDVGKAMSAGDYEEAEENLRWLLERNPKDAKIQANLAFALTSQGKDAEALPIYAKLVESGEGTYDIFAYYAKTLDAVGRTDDAITWSYRALLLVPQLVDVRGDLAKLLVKKGRKFEALSLLASFDNELQSHGRPAYFEAQRIAIASALPPPADVAGSDAAYSTVRVGGHFYTVAIGEKEEAIPFLIDTGASHTTMSHEVLRMFDLRVPASSRSVELRTAGGHIIMGQFFTVPFLRIGPYALKDLQIVVCDNCESLLGQTTLERFDLKTIRADGLEILSMTPRAEHP